MPTDLSEIAVDEVSPVARTATRKRWALLKADDEDGIEMAQANFDALASPLPDEEALVAKLSEEGMNDDAQEAAVAALRLLKASGEHTEAVLKASAYWASPQEHTTAEAAAIETAGEDDEDEDDSLDEDARPDAEELAKSELAGRILKSLDDTLTAEPVAATSATTGEPRDLAARITKSLETML